MLRLANRGFSATLWPSIQPKHAQRFAQLGHPLLGGVEGEHPDLGHALRLDDGRKRKADSENDREPDQPHGTSIVMAGGSLADDG